jgi:hypothetical protein
MSAYSKIGIARPSFPKAHPFKIDIGKLKSSPGSPPKFTLSVNFHSGLFDGFSLSNNRFTFKRLAITGLDFPQTVPESFPGRNFYCVLKTTFLKGEPNKSTIEWISSNDQQASDDLAPIKVEQQSTGSGPSATQTKIQTEARVIIGVLVSDDEVIAGLPGGASAVKTPYVIQYINTNLVFTELCLNGVSVRYPFPMSGGQLNV